MRQNESGFYIVNLYFKKVNTFEQFLVHEEAVDRIVNTTKKYAAGRLLKITRNRLITNKTDEEIYELSISRKIMEDIEDNPEDYSFGVTEMVWKKQ